MLESTRTVAAELGVSPQTVHRWVREGNLKPSFVTPGGRYRWERGDFLSQLGVESCNGPARGPRVNAGTPTPGLSLI